jgi:hypothetical protein
MAGIGAFGKNDISGNTGFLGTPNQGVFGNSVAGVGAGGNTVSGNGVVGTAQGNGTGVRGWSAGGYGVYGKSDNASSYAGYFDGNVFVTGTVNKAACTFKIDHPQDPENKYLIHSTVESPDMKNVYDGTVLMDENGEATVELPSYFQSLNRDFRYQLTAMGSPGPNLYIAEEISGNHFKIAGGKAGAKVSWMVTGIRQDAFANAHPIVVEQEKPAGEKGLYLNPKEWGQPESKSISAQPAKETLK